MSKSVLSKRIVYLHATSTERPYEVEIFTQPRNLKTSPGITGIMKEALGGVSESSLLQDSLEYDERSSRALQIAYKRCEEVYSLCF